jgi:hypothetical protein
MIVSRKTARARSRGVVGEGWTVQLACMAALLLSICSINCASSEIESAKLDLRVVDASAQTGEYEIGVLPGERTGNTPWETSTGAKIVSGPPAFVPLKEDRYWGRFALADVYTVFVKTDGEVNTIAIRVQAEPDDAISGIIRIDGDGALSFEETGRVKELPPWKKGE